MKLRTLQTSNYTFCIFRFTDSLIFFALSMNTAALSGSVFLNTFLIGAVEIPANIIGRIFEITPHGHPKIWGTGPQQ